MKNKHSNRNMSRVTVRRLALAVALCALTAAPLLSSTRAEQTSTSIQITNSSSVEIRHIYFSPVDSDDWGPDQLNQAVLTNGNSITLENAACTQGQIKVVAEDQNGCFISTTITCGDSSTWTITDTTERSCGN
jgi:hypothetical protein